jgi:hypothetical protein
MVEPLLADQELSTANSSRVVYWEGAVRARRTSGGHQTRGVGYVELVGYAGSWRGSDRHPATCRATTCDPRLPVESAIPSSRC